MAEIARDGVQAVGRSQSQTASARGIARLQAFGRITLPKALRKYLTPIGHRWFGIHVHRDHMNG